MSLEIVAIDLCVVRLRVTIYPVFGLGVFCRLNRWPLLTAVVGPVVFEVARR